MAHKDYIWLVWRTDALSTHIHINRDIFMYVPPRADLLPMLRGMVANISRSALKQPPIVWVSYRKKKNVFVRLDGKKVFAWVRGVWM